MVEWYCCPFPFHPSPHVWAQHEKSQLPLLGGVLHPRPWVPKSGRIYPPELWSSLSAHSRFRTLSLITMNLAWVRMNPATLSTIQTLMGLWKWPTPAWRSGAPQQPCRTCCSGTSWPNPSSASTSLGKNPCPGKDPSNEALWGLWTTQHQTEPRSKKFPDTMGIMCYIQPHIYFWKFVITFWGEFYFKCTGRIFNNGHTSHMMTLFLKMGNAPSTFVQ